MALFVIEREQEREMSLEYELSFCIITMVYLIVADLLME